MYIPVGINRVNLAITSQIYLILSLPIPTPILQTITNLIYVIVFLHTFS